MSQYRKPPAYAINGIIVLDKPLGVSSNSALQTVKRLLRANKAGHTGALDPAASGVLPLCFGEATKFSQYLLDAKKAYRCEISFGVSTDTGDVEGAVLQEQDASALTEAQLQQCLAEFIGPMQQMPPMYSALKHKGQPLYKLARQGQEVERQARAIEILAIELESFVAGRLARAVVHVHCSKGTYIRVLAEDIGRRLGFAAHLSGLRRTLAGPFSLNQSVTIERLQAKLEEVGGAGNDCAEVDEAQSVIQCARQVGLLAVDAGIQHIEELTVSEEQARTLYLGQRVNGLQKVRKGAVRVMLRAAFLGIAEYDGESLKAKRLLSASAMEAALVR